MRGGIFFIEDKIRKKSCRNVPVFEKIYYICTRNATGCSSARLEYASGGRVVASSNLVTPTSRESAAYVKHRRLILFLRAEWLKRAADATADGEKGRGRRTPGRGMSIFFRIFAQNPVLRPLLFMSCRPQIFCLYTPSIAILDVCGGKNVDFPRNVFQMRRNLPGFLAISGFLRFFSRRACPALRERRPRCGIAAVPCQQMLNTKTTA